MRPIPGERHPDQRPVDIGSLDLAGRADEALAVQALAFGLTDDEVSVRHQIVLRHATMPGALALGATTENDRLVGFVYGMPNDRTQWWSSVVHPYLQQEGHDHWLDEAFVITELHVHPAFQNRGLGRELITRLTDAAREPRSILSAIDTESPARALYRSLGYRDLARRVHFPSAASRFVVMGAPLPLRGR